MTIRRFSIRLYYQRKNACLKFREDSVNASLRFIRMRSRSAFAINRNRSSMHNSRFVAAQEQNNLGNLLRLWPLGKVGVGHRRAIGLSVNDAGQNRIHPDAGPFQVLGKAIEERQSSRFGGRVGCRAGSMVKSGSGGDVHDGAAPEPQHGGNTGADHVVPSAQIEGEHELKGFRFRLPRRLARGVTTNGVYQDIESAITRGDSSDQGAAGRFIGSIERLEFKMRMRANRVAKSIGLVLLDITSNHRRTFMQERQTHGPAKTACAARDESDFLIESIAHNSSIPLF